MGRLKGSLFYLSGPIDKAIDSGNLWREEITPSLLSMGIGILNPCKKPTSEALEGEDLRKEIDDLKEKEDWLTIETKMKPVVFYDLRMVDLASCIIVYIDPSIYACGTWDETFTAIGQQKPVLLIAPKGLKTIPNWMFGRIKHDMMFDSIEKCLKYLSQIDSGELTPSYKKWKFFDFSKIFS